MRFLGIGDFCDLSALYLRLLSEGHEVKVHIAKPLCRSTMNGLVEQAPDWKAELPWLREAGDEGIILFENVAERRGALQDVLRRDGFHVIGGSAYGDRLENDRGFAQAVLKDLGLSICPVHEFSKRQLAMRFLDEHPDRYVLKFNGPMESFVGRMKDGRDVRAFLAGLPPAAEEVESFVLMQHVDGVEMGVGAYFDGEKFLTPSCLDWEHKRFFPGDLGENTGEMGTVVTYDRTARFHELTLMRMEKLLRDGGYCGYINLNTIVNERGIWPLEFTCRFGYPGYAILDPIQETPWSDLFHAMVTRSSQNFSTLPGFSVGIVMTTPPFPYARPAVDEPVGLPILFDEGLTDNDRRHLHYGEVGMQNGQLVTSGAYGWTMVVTGTGATIREAQRRANDLAERVIIPNVRYRRDIGDRLMAGDFDRIEMLGLLDEQPTERDDVNDSERYVEFGETPREGNGKLRA
jgi:phosphoribosylamine--glycine ligase